MLLHNDKGMSRNSFRWYQFPMIAFQTKVHIAIKYFPYPFSGKNENQGVLTTRGAQGIDMPS